MPRSEKTRLIVRDSPVLLRALVRQRAEIFNNYGDRNKIDWHSIARGKPIQNALIKR